MTKSLASFEPVERTETLGRKAREKLRAAIMAGQFSPGDKLTIRAVASALQVSLTPAREALYNLAAEGALEMRANGSVYVHTLDEERIHEITKIRIALEGLAARESVNNISDKDIKTARRIHEQMTRANKEGRYEDVIRLNWEFHFHIYNNSRMPNLIRMIEACWLMTGSYLNVIYPEFGEIDDGIKNHERILKALEARSADKLAEAITRDIHFAATTLTASVSDPTSKHQS